MTAPASPSDPRSFLAVLGSRPDASLVHQAQLALARIDSNLSRSLSSLSSKPPPSDPLLLAQWSASQVPCYSSLFRTRAGRERPISYLSTAGIRFSEQEVAKAREEAEQAKLPYKSIVSLFELHQIYHGLLNNPDPRIMKTLTVLNSFTERNHVDQESQSDVASLLLEAAQKGSNRLDLSARLLRSLPASFGNLATLVSLDLSKNQLKELPRSIGDLNNLEILDLQSNQLPCLPDSIGYLDALRILNVSGNMLVALPDSIGGCRSLVELIAGFNKLDRLPARIGYDFIFLETLALHTNKLTFLPPSICELKRLKFLDLHFNNLKSLPQSIGNLTALQKLNICNNFSDFGPGGLPDSIGGLLSLVELDISFNQVRVLPDSVGALENLKLLKVDNNPLVIPPVDVVEHSMEAMIEYMAIRWKTSPAYEEEIVSSPRSGRSKHQRRVGCVGMGGSWLVNLIARKCSGRDSSTTAISKILAWQVLDHSHDQLMDS